MMPKYSEQQISKALFEIDLMNTCCRENECFDEYDSIAEAITERLTKGESLEQALTAEISEWFFDGDEFDRTRLKPVLELLGEGEQ